MITYAVRRAAWAAIVVISPAWAIASPVAWTINSAASTFTLQIPDQLSVYNGGATVSFQTRNQTGSVSTPWNTNTMHIAGTVDTDYDEVGGTIQFLAGQTDIGGVNSGSFRPNPAAWNGGTSTYTNTSTAPADIGGLLRFIPPIIGIFPMQFSFDDTMFDLTSGALPFVINGAVNLAGTSLTADTLSSFQGNPNTGVLMNVPSYVSQPLSFGGANNNALGSISATGSLRHLEIPFQQNFNISIGGALLAASSSGVLVMDAVVPEPSTLLLAGIGLVALCCRVKRRPEVR